MIARILAMLGGAVLLSAVAHVTVISTGGYFTPHSYLTLAIAAGAGLGSIFSGMAWSAKRHTLAVCFVIAILSGEVFGFIQTAERLITSREALQAPLRGIQEGHGKAARRVEVAVAAVAAVPTTSKRLADAITAKASADAAAVAKSSERGCRENCRQLLQAQVDAARLEVEAARAELTAHKAAAEAELEAARAELGLVKAPQSPTPLADRLGAPAWVIDLVTSALGSIAANGLACCLLIFGAHHSARLHNDPDTPNPKNAAAVVRDVPMQDMTRLDAAPLAITAQPVDRREHVAQFLRSTLQPDPSGAASLRQLHTRYPDWCRRQAADLLPPAELGRHLRSIVDAIGLECEPAEHDVVIKGAVIRASAP
jgi:hypothetical protein